MKISQLPYVAASIVFSTPKYDLVKNITKLTSTIPKNNKTMNAYDENGDKEYAWEYEIVLLNEKSIMNPLRKLISKFSSNNELFEFLKKERIRTDLVVVVHAIDTEMPELFLDNELIRFMHEINAEISFDVYTYPVQSQDDNIW